MAPHTTVKTSNRYHYYHCDKRWQEGTSAYIHEKHHRADKLETEVWAFVCSLLKDPERLRAGLDRMVEEESKGVREDPDQEAKT